MDGAATPSRLFEPGDIVTEPGHGSRFRVICEINRGIHIGYTLWEVVRLSGGDRRNFILDGRYLTKMSPLERLALET